MKFLAGLLVALCVALAAGAMPTPNRPPQILATHLRRRAFVYLRQSTRRQVETNQGSTLAQRDQQEFAIAWGWLKGEIDVIDEDLGLSGTSGERRTGWQRLLRAVADGTAVIILVGDISRLSRSRRDFAVLVELCRTNDVLLAVEGRIVDFDNSTDRFMANIRADVAEYDNEVRREIMMKGARAKARRGYAVRRPPVGYVEGPAGQWRPDPDLSVRKAITAVFDDFERFRTLGRLLRHYWENGIRLPVRGKK